VAVAHITKAAKGWRVQVARQGVRRSKVLPTKRAAELWAAAQEADIIAEAAAPPAWPQRTVSDAIDAWLKAKPRGRMEHLSLQQLQREHAGLCAMVISDVTPVDLAAWRDARLAQVSPGTVRRQATILRSIWAHSARDLGWSPYPTPWPRVRLPADNAPRDRLITWREARAILRRLHYRTGVVPSSAVQAIGVAFMIALRTGMRCGEILRLRPKDVRGSVATVLEHKTKAATGKPRMVPLTPAGVRLLALLPRDGLSVAPATLDALFRRTVQALGIHDLHFHDSRATFATHMAKRVPVEVLARITGHKDLKILFSTYYRETPDAIAARLVRRVAPT
jgi:integrase